MNTARLFAVALLGMVAVALGSVDYDYDYRPRPPHYEYRPRPRRHHEWRIDPSVFEVRHQNKLDNALGCCQCNCLQNQGQLTAHAAICDLHFVVVLPGGTHAD